MFNEIGKISLYVICLSLVFFIASTFVNHTFTMGLFGGIFIAFLIIIKEFGLSRDDIRRKLNRMKEFLLFMHEQGIITAEEFERYLNHIKTIKH